MDTKLCPYPLFTKPVLRIRIRVDPFHFGQPDLDPLQWNGSGSWWQKISQNHGKFQQKSTKIIRISYIFFKIIKLCLLTKNIYSINNKTDHFSEKYIFYRNIFPILGRIWSRIRIRILGSVLWNNGSEISKWNGSETPVWRARYEPWSFPRPPPFLPGDNLNTL